MSNNQLACPTNGSHQHTSGDFNQEVRIQIGGQIGRFSRWHFIWTHVLRLLSSSPIYALLRKRTECWAQCPEKKSCLFTTQLVLSVTQVQQLGRHRKLMPLYGSQPSIGAIKIVHQLVSCLSQHLSCFIHLNWSKVLGKISWALVMDPLFVPLPYPFHIPLKHTSDNIAERRGIVWSILGF